MNNKFRDLLLRLKYFLIKGKLIFTSIFFWQLFLTIICFSATNLLILLIVGIFYLLTWIIFI